LAGTFRVKRFIRFPFSFAFFLLLEPSEGIRLYKALVAHPHNTLFLLAIFIALQAVFLQFFHDMTDCFSKTVQSSVVKLKKMSKTG